MGDIAMRVGITERAVQRIIAGLEREGYMHVIRQGRRNRYRIHKNDIFDIRSRAIVAYRICWRSLRQIL